MHPTTRRLLAWYEAEQRDLPWRRDPTPYHTWLSEIMLQQTRIEAATPYYERFLERWPTVEALAEASLEDVLGAWSGLGYYRRARNLHEAAGQVVALGGFPDTPAGLRALAGVGEYTAAAIASIAFGRDAVAVDGNLRRVVARLDDIDVVVASGPGARRVRGWLEARLPTGRAGDFNQALMDLGATICIPKAPRCGRCPLAEDCLARAAGHQAELPISAPRKAPRAVSAVALIARRGGAVALTQRPATGLLAGLWGPPDGVVDPGGDADAVLSALLQGLAPGCAAAAWPVGTVEHIFTHQHWRVRVFELALPDDCELAADLRWWRSEAADGPPLSRLAERILALQGGVPEQGP